MIKKWIGKLRKDKKQRKGSRGSATEYDMSSRAMSMPVISGGGGYYHHGMMTDDPYNKAEPLPKDFA